VFLSYISATRRLFDAIPLATRKKRIKGTRSTRRTQFNPHACTSCRKGGIPDALQFGRCSFSHEETRACPPVQWHLRTSLADASTLDRIAIIASQVSISGNASSPLGRGPARNYLTADTRRGRGPRNKKFRKVFDRIADENEVNAVAFGNARSG